MATRTFWKGYLKLALVTCPVTMEPARTAGETWRFHTVNRKTGNRVESRYLDAKTGKLVAEEHQAKGYEIEDDRFVENEELEAVGHESTRTIDIERFVPRDDVGWTWLDRPHLLKPGDKVDAAGFRRRGRGPRQLSDRATGRGTVVDAVISYRPPGGEIGRWIAKLFQREPSIQGRRELKRLKMLMETGEIATSDNRKHI